MARIRADLAYKRCQICSTHTRRALACTRPLDNPPTPFRPPTLKTRPGILSPVGNKAVVRPNTKINTNSHPRTPHSYPPSLARPNLPRERLNIQTTTNPNPGVLSKPILSPSIIQQNVKSSNLAQTPPRTSKRIKVRLPLFHSLYPGV
jgi:hypothetical protein